MALPKLIQMLIIQRQALVRKKETYSTKWQYGSSEGDRNKDENVVVDANTYKMYCDREPRFFIFQYCITNNGILVVREILTFIWMVKTVVLSRRSMERLSGT